MKKEKRGRPKKSEKDEIINVVNEVKPFSIVFPSNAMNADGSTSEYNIVLNPGTTFPLGQNIKNIIVNHAQNCCRLQFDGQVESRTALDIYLSNAEQLDYFKQYVLCWTRRNEIKEIHSIIKGNSTYEVKVIMDFDSNAFGWAYFFSFTEEERAMEFAQEMKRWLEMKDDAHKPFRLYLPVKNEEFTDCGVIETTEEEKPYFFLLLLKDARCVLIINVQEK